MGDVFWGVGVGGILVSQSLPQLPFTKSSIQCVFHFTHCSQTEWTVFCFQQHWSASELLGPRILEGKWSARPGEMAHCWEALIDLPWGGHWLRTTLRSLFIYWSMMQLKQVYIFLCARVMLENRSNKRPTQEKVKCLAHSVWDVNEFSILGRKGKLPCISFFSSELQHGK